MDLRHPQAIPRVLQLVLHHWVGRAGKPVWVPGQLQGATLMQKTCSVRCSGKPMNPREHSGNQVFHHWELPVCLVCPYQILDIQLGEESIRLPWCKESACNTGHPGSIPASRRSPGVGHGNPLQYSCLENSMNKGAWWAVVRGVSELDMTEAT